MGTEETIRTERTAHRQPADTRTTLLDGRRAPIGVADATKRCERGLRDADALRDTLASAP